MTGTLAFMATLLLRAAVNGSFMIWLLTFKPTWADIFWTGSFYAFADGTLGLLSGVLLARHLPVSAPPVLVSMVLADAVMRVCAGVAIHVFPGIPYFPLTVVLFFGVLGAWAAAAGAIAMIAWLTTHRHHAKEEKRSRLHALFDPLSVAGLVALVVAVYSIIAGPPSNAGELRIAASAASAALAFVFLAAVVFGRRSA